MLNRRCFIKSSVTTGLALWAGATLGACSGITRRDLPALHPQGHRQKELALRDVRALSAGMNGRLVYFPRGSQHAGCIAEAAVEAFRIQSWRDEAQRELVNWLRLDDAAARRHRDGLSAEGMELTGFKVWFVYT